MSNQSTLEKLNTCLKGSPFLAGPDATQVRFSKQQQQQRFDRKV
jgi:hypothetical protein